MATALEDWLTLRSAGRGLSANTLRAYRRDIAAVAEQLAGRAARGDQRSAAERVTVDALTPDSVVAALGALGRAGAAPATAGPHPRHGSAPSAPISSARASCVSTP